FKSGGRLQGELNVVSVPCDAATHTCTITVPASRFALVFLNEKAYTGFTPSGETVTFAATAYTKSINTTIDLQVLQTSNGHSGKDHVNIRSTSKGSSLSSSTTLREGLVNILLTGLGVGLGVALFALL
ncbi:hypothetical protein BDM02DRAFT_3096090, partial [Thelephora ganbajun]